MEEFDDGLRKGNLSEARNRVQRVRTIFEISVIIDSRGRQKSNLQSSEQLGVLKYSPYCDVKI